MDELQNRSEKFPMILNLKEKNFLAFWFTSTLLQIYKSFQLVVISFFGCNREAKLCKKKKQDRLILNSNK